MLTKEEAKIAKKKCIIMWIFIIFLLIYFFPVISQLKKYAFINFFFYIYKIIIM